MNRKTWYTSIIVLLVVVAMGMLPLAAAIHTSIPIGHRVYRVLDVAQVRGLIDGQVAARPFSANKVMTLLAEIQKQDDKLSSSER